jgi:hypothetical protein
MIVEVKVNATKQANTTHRQRINIVPVSFEGA